MFKVKEMPESDIFVYGLLDPDTKQLRYIGQTSVGIKRLKYHYYECNKLNKNTGFKSASKHWISSLRKNNKCFDVVYLEYCSTKELNDVEIFYINYFKYLGVDLLNHQPGGQVNVMSDSFKKVISERTKSAMNNPKIKQMCREHAFKTVAGKNKGKKFSKEFKDKISKAQDSKVFYFILDGEKIRGFKNLAKKLNCTLSAVNHYVAGRCKTVKGKTPLIIYPEKG